MAEILSPQGSDCHEAAVQWEGNFTRHAAQSPKAKTIEDTGVSESSELLMLVLRHSRMFMQKPLRRFQCGLSLKENVVCFQLSDTRSLTLIWTGCRITYLISIR